MKFFVIIKDQSERVPDKNFRMLGEKFLYKHLLDRLPDNKTYVNTDSKRVEGKFIIIERKEKHILWEKERPSSPVLSMIEDFLNEHVQDENEIIVTPHVTSPFLKLETILEASRLIGEYDSVLSCTIHKEFAYLKSDKEIKPINFGYNMVKRTQDLDPIIFQNGAFFIFTKKTFMEQKNRIGVNPFFFKLSFPESLEIDYEQDYALAKLFLLNKVKGQK